MMDPDSKIGGTNKLYYMVATFAIMFLITAVISWLWVRGIDKQIEYQKENPDYNPNEGWLDWDDNKSSTEGEI
jgi:hypothetical protein